jgi:hypothetical protein
MNYSVNQVRQLYVAKALKTPHVLASDDAGSIAVKTDTAKNHLYFEYKGADNLMRSDLIDIKSILHVNATDADNMAHKLKAVKVTLDSEINAGVPVSGQDYILRIAFKQYIGMSEEDQYFKYGMVHAYAGMTASDFYKKLAMSLVKNFSREVVPLVKFALVNSDDDTVPVDATTKESSLTETYTALVIEEVEQPWRLGVMEQTPVYFMVQPTTIIVNGDERIWGIAKDTDSAGIINNGKKIADLEYFCMGERGDIYRNINWPHNIPTTYLVDPTIKYNIIDIHYAYVGSNESIQKSEKTITLVVPKIGETNSVSNVLTNNIISAINTATGLSIADLDTAE